MKRMKPAYAYLAVCVALMMGWFYWFELRPERIRNECAIKMLKRAKERDSSVDVAEKMISFCIKAGDADELVSALESAKPAH